MTPQNATALTACYLSAAFSGAADAVPEWIHLLPAGTFRTVDGRGPFMIEDAARLAADSLAAGGMLPIDETHATDFAAPRGEPAPARGWIVALEARGDGIWGKVEWTDAGRQLVADRAYQHVSSVIVCDKNLRVTRIVRAALTNNPAVPNLARFQTESNMDLLNKLRELLGLAEDADDNAIFSAVRAIIDAAAVEKAKAAAGTETMQAIARAAGLKEDADTGAIVSAVTALAAKGNDAVAALQQELTQTAQQLVTLQTKIATQEAEAFVDAAIREGRVAVKPLRDHFIARFVRDADAVKKEINAMPVVCGNSIVPLTPPKDKDGKAVLDDGDKSLIAQLGIDPEAYKKTLAAEAGEEIAA